MCVKVTAMTRNTNDNMLNIYLSSLIRAIIALHELMVCFNVSKDSGLLLYCAISFCLLLLLLLLLLFR
jgi:hypothetical protein